MTNLAHLPSPPSSVELGPATLVDAGPALVAERHGRRLPVTIAVPAPYRPTLGDEVLLMGNDDGWYIVGVLHQRGASQLSVEGDLTIEAQGQVRLVGREGVAVEGREVHLRGERLVSLFEDATHRFGRLFQSVRDLFSQQAGQLDTTVEGTHHTRARNANLVTQERVKINGKTIHLG